MVAEDNGNKNVTAHWWNAALYDHNTGKPFAAFYELKNFVGDDTAVSTVEAERFLSSQHVITIDGRQVGNSDQVARLPKGIYIVGNKKRIRN